VSRLLFAGYAGLALGCAVADQFIKRLVVDNMQLHERIDLVPMLSLYHTRNTGIAFSFLSGFDDSLMVVFTAGVMIFIAFILGGALGNIVDRAVLGYVVDYILFYTETWSFAVFNLADAFISVGAALVILQELLDWRRGDRGTSAPPDA
jgi:signal peptidase II